MKIYLYILFFIAPCIGFGQSVSLDSLVLLTKNMKDDSSKALNLFSISNRYRIEKVDYPNAKKFAQESILLSEKLNYASGIFRATIALGYTYREMGLNTEAVSELLKALNIFESKKELQRNTELHINHLNTYTAISDIYTVLNDFTNAEKYASRALQLSEIYKTGSGKCLLTLSNIFSQQNNVQEAKKYAGNALAEFKKENSLADIARTYAFLARYAYKEEDYNSAIDYYKLSFEHYKQANNIYGARIALYNLAQVYVKIGNNNKALECISEIEKKYASQSTDAVFLNQLKKLSFNINFSSKNYPELLKICKGLLDYAIKEKSVFNIKEAYGKYLLVYLEMKDTANAFVMSEKISSLKDTLYNADIAKNTAALAKKFETEKKEQQIAFLDKENKLNQEKLVQERQLLMALKNENLLKEAKLYKEHLLSEALARENQLKTDKIEQNIAIQKGLERENSLKKTELAEKDVLNKTLQTQNTLILENSKKEKIIRWLLFIVLIGFIAFGFNYFKNYRKEKLANQKINKQANEMMVLMREIHHRVKNNLQVIISMLRMQARTIDDTIAKEALLHSENRLQSIAIVHEQLYRSNNLDGVILKDYLKDLMEELVNQYQHVVPNFTYTINDNTALTTNLDTAIPLAMIVNELVTNSFKYAFTNLQDAKINIQLDRLNNNDYQLTVQDNGPGFDNAHLSSSSTTLGLKLVHLFTEQLNGSIKYTANAGSCFMLSFKAI